MKKKIINLLLLLTIFLPITAYADNRVINGNDYNVYKKTKTEISGKWATGKLDIPENYNNIYETTPSYTSPYRAGVVKQSYLNDVLDNLNYYRYLIGVKEISTYPVNDNELQTADVVQQKSLESGNPLTHYLYSIFDKPDDMTTEFYNLGAHANHNIVAYGVPEEPNFFFFDESVYDDSNPTAGHRMALLGPEMSQIEYGIGESVIYGRIHYNPNNYNTMENDFAAYPAPGNFPKQDLANISDWDVFLNINKFKFLEVNEENNVIVTIKNLTTNLTETRSVLDGNLQFDYDCWGNDCNPYYRLHIERPTRLTTYYEDSYEVYIENLIDDNNQLVDIKYTVNFYDKFEGITSSISNVMFDLNLIRVFSDGEYHEDIIKSLLEGTNVNITLESGSSFDAPVDDYTTVYDGKYTDNSTAYRYYPNVSELPTWAKDDNHVLDSTFLHVFYYPDEEYYRYEYADMAYNKNVGNAITMLIEDYYPHVDGTAVYVWLKEENGEFHELTDENKYSTTGLALTIKNLTKEDAGNYYLATILVPDRYVGTRIYLSKPLTLTISNPATGISMSPNELSLKVGDNYKLTPTLTPIDADTVVTYTSSDELVVSVDSEGNIQGLKEGTAIVTAHAGNYTAELTITVTNNMPGDMNKNDKIDLNDIIVLLKKYLGVEETTNEDIQTGDLNNNNKIDLNDIILLLKTYLGVN